MATSDTSGAAMSGAAMSGAAMSGAEVEQWSRTGVVTCRTPLCDDADLLCAAQECMLRKFPRPRPTEGGGRLSGMMAADPAEQALIDVAQHPWFEAAAKQCLRADTVRFCAAACATSYPQGGAFKFDQHVDIQYTEEEWEASPRRVVVSFFIWLAEANSRRAPLVYRPGSHRLIAAENSRRHRAGEVRRLAWEDGAPWGAPPPLDGPATVHGASLQLLPLPFEEPVPAEGPAGSATVTTTALVHGASSNVDDAPRMSMHLTFCASAVDICNFSFPELWAELQPLLRPERQHIAQLESMSMPPPQQQPRL
jgi:hypothetical protein